MTIKHISEQAVDRPEVLVKGLAVHIGLTRDVGDRDVLIGLLRQQVLERRDHSRTRAEHATVDALALGRGRRGRL